MTRALPWVIAIPGLIVAAVYLLLSFGDVWRMLAS